MPEVTALRNVRKACVQVELDGEAAFVLYKGEIARLAIEEGKELTAGECERIRREILLPRAVKRLLYLLQRKDYTEKQLEEKLTRGLYPEEVIRGALQALEGFGYVNDADYARRYLSCYQGRKSRGSMKQQLLQRGIPRQLVEQALLEWEEDEGETLRSEQEMIEELLQKRHYDPQTADAKEKQRQYAFLARRGFRGSDITAVLFREAG
ncbi:MAG: recombination regulator RecX [Lachnospiraceae bacterium]|nr:recombination regulator RecX [Lachnospiraceae bacterium]